MWFYCSNVVFMNVIFRTLCRFTDVGLSIFNNSSSIFTIKRIIVIYAPVDTWIMKILFFLLDTKECLFKNLKPTTECFYFIFLLKSRDFTKRIHIFYFLFCFSIKLNFPPCKTWKLDYGQTFSLYHRQQWMWISCWSRFFLYFIQIPYT